MPLDRPEDLGVFEDQIVDSVNIAVTNAGDGLSAAMDVDPVILHHDEEVYVVLRCRVSKIQFVPIKDEHGKVQRVHILKAQSAALMEHSAVKKALDAQEQRIAVERERRAREKEEAEGVHRLDGIAEVPDLPDDDDFE